MLTVILSILIVILLLVSLQIYAKCILKRHATTRTTTGSRSTGVAAVQVRSHAPPKRGLDPAVIASLPILVYRAHVLGKDTITECAVCLGTLQEEEMARVLPSCRHTFHVGCIDMWLTSHSTCPICRNGVEPQPQKEITEPVDAAPPMAPAVESVNSSTPSMNSEGTSGDGTAQSDKVSGSGSRLSSFRRMLGGDRSSRMTQPCDLEDAAEHIV